MSEFDQEADVVIIGSGAAALTTAVTAKEHGLSVLVVESTELIGGSTAKSGGGLWIPNNHLMKEQGVPDDPEQVRLYMDTVIDQVGPATAASSPERREAFIHEGPEMVKFLEGLGFNWIYRSGYADYHPEEPGGSAIGRGVEGRMFNIKKIGELRRSIRPGVPIPMYTFEVGTFMRAFRTFKGFCKAVQIIGIRTILGRLIGKHYVTNGQTLIAQLLGIMQKQGIQVQLNSPMVEILVDGDRAVGVVVEREGERVRLGAHKAVVIGAGGFASNDELRKKYLPNPTSAEWTSANIGDQGGPIQAGIAIGAATALMDDAWWGPSALDPATGAASFMVSERSFPHSMIVDTSGKRYMNESASYVDCGHWMYERDKTVPAVPSWLIMESRHRNSYPFGFAMPRMTPKSMFESGYFIKADTLEELAEKLEMSPETLKETAARFSAFARTGKDEDFGRGDSAYDHVYGDPRVKPNPNLGAIEKGPFYATKVYPGDLGTKGGILTDEHARALREDGSVIEGLYAAGNSSASVMGRRYPGPGSTIGPAMTFGYIAAKHIAGA